VHAAVCIALSSVLCAQSVSAGSCPTFSSGSNPSWFVYNDVSGSEGTNLCLFRAPGNAVRFASAATVCSSFDARSHSPPGRISLLKVRQTSRPSSNDGSLLDVVSANAGSGTDVWLDADDVGRPLQWSDGRSFEIRLDGSPKYDFALFSCRYW
jgi:hypothetical protein